MKKKISLLLTVIMLCMVCLTGCTCEHEWTTATCQELPKCCLCGMQGVELGEHKWIEATCTEAKTCRVCGVTEGDKLGHEWTEATCEKASYCNKCKETIGDPKGHTLVEMTVVTEPTCSEAGASEALCTECGELVTEEIPKLAHTPADWVVTQEATISTSGVRTQSCLVCEETIKTEEFDLSPEEVKDLYKAECVSYTYEEIARNPDAFKGNYAKFKGEVIQVIEDGNDYTLRVNITEGRYYWDDTILVIYTKKDSSEPRILEDDIVWMYGKLAGTYTYETVMGSQLTVPFYQAEYIDIE